jgi:hypothetical protein
MLPRDKIGKIFIYIKKSPPPRLLDGGEACQDRGTPGMLYKYDPKL